MRFWNKFDKKYLKISRYAIISVGLAYALILILGQYKALASSTWRALSCVGAIIKPVVFGAILAYIVHPLTEVIETKLLTDKNGQYRTKGAHALSVLLTIILIVAAIAVLSSIVVLAITKQIKSLNSDSISTLINSIILQAESFERNLRVWANNMNLGDGFILKLEHNLMHKLTGLLDNGRGIPGILQAIAAGASTALFSLMFAVYFLLDHINLRKYWGTIIRTLWSQKVNDSLKALYDDVDRVFSGYFRGAAADGLMVGVLISVAFTIAGMPYGAMIGLAAGIANLIPYMGPIVGYGFTALSGIITGQINTMIICLVIISVVQVLDGAIINPKLLSKSIEVHPMLVIIAIIAGNKVGGFMGMLLAVPVAALIKIWFERFVNIRGSRKNREEHQC